MISLITKSPIGVFAFKEDGELLYYELFSHEPVKAVEEFSKPAEIQIDGYEPKEDIRTARFLRKRFREYAIDSRELLAEAFLPITATNSPSPIFRLTFRRAAGPSV